MATAGPITVSGASSMNWRASASMLPQLGSGGGGPKPRNDRAVTVKMVLARIRLVCTRIGETTIGSTWRSAMANSPTPTLRAASTWSQRLTLSTGPRTTRAIAGV